MCYFQQQIQFVMSTKTVNGFELVNTSIINGCFPIKPAKCLYTVLGLNQLYKPSALLQVYTAVSSASDIHVIQALYVNTIL